MFSSSFLAILYLHPRDRIGIASTDSMCLAERVRIQCCRHCDCSAFAFLRAKVRSTRFPSLQTQELHFAVWLAKLA